MDLLLFFFKNNLIGKIINFLKTARLGAVKY